MFRPLDDEWVIFDPENAKVHVLNLTAALVWSHCLGEMNQAQIASAVTEAFDEPPPKDALVRDVRNVIERFELEGLLQ